MICNPPCLLVSHQLMKEHYRVLLFPLKLPKLSSNIPPISSQCASNNSSPLLSPSPSTLGLQSSSPTPVPFLFVHLNKSLKKNSNPATGLNRRSPLTRFLNWGESKWQEYGEASPRSIKGVMHRIGSTLLDKIPVTEKQLWRLHALNQHFQSDLEQVRNKNLEIETGSCYLGNPSLEQSVKFDLISQYNSWAAYHRRWSIFSSCLIIPVAILSILPFGKLFLAWIIFRAVAHWRAYQGAHFLVRCFNFDRQDKITDILPVKLVTNHLIDKNLPLPPNFTSETCSFNDPIANLARDLDLGELANILPKALKLIIKNELKQQSQQSMTRRKFSNQNLLDP